MLTVTDTSLVLANAALRVVFTLTAGRVAPARLEGADGSVWADTLAAFFLDLRHADGSILRANALRLLSHATRETAAGLELVLETAPDFAASAVPGSAPTPHDARVLLRYVLAPAAAVLTEQIEILAQPAAAATSPLRLHRASLFWRLKSRPGLACRPVPFGEGHGSAAPVLLTDAASGRHFQRDGAVLHDAARNLGLLIAKTPSDRDPEFVVTDLRADGVDFSGFSPDPSFNDCPRWLDTGRYLSSPTRFELVPGTIERAFTAHRAFMDAHGLALPADYAPPFNYCIYYECRSDWTRAEATALIPVAASLGCTLLYTDQGWETGFGSGLWDDARLGPCADFVAEAARSSLAVGVLVSLHCTPQGATAWPPQVFRRSPLGTVEDGDRWHPHGVCAQSPDWREEKTRRLARVAADGVGFFSFDFNDAKDYVGHAFRRYPCHAAGHDHAGPQTEWQHVAGDASLPGYLFPASAQERWGFEYMWNPFEDLRAGRLQNLVWFKLAYSRPLYLHLDLANDHPEHLTAFWFLASTIRHLGIGNFTTLAPDRQARVRAACALYVAHREFFTRGVFFASGPRAHVHALPGRGAVVIFFNDTDAPLDLAATFTAADLGLSLDATPRLTPWLGPALAHHAPTDTANHRFTVTLPPWAVSAATLA